MNTVHLPSHDKIFTQYFSVNSNKNALANFFKQYQGKRRNPSSYFMFEYFHSSIWFECVIQQELYCCKPSFQENSIYTASRVSVKKCKYLSIFNHLYIYTNTAQKERSPFSSLPRRTNHSYQSGGKWYFLH